MTQHVSCFDRSNFVMVFLDQNHVKIFPHRSFAGQSKSIDPNENENVNI